MSRWPGRLITKTPVTPGGSAPNASAPGVWTLPEMAYWKKQGLWPDASADAYWGYVSYLMATSSLSNASNNLFVDSSGAFNPVARVGNTNQGAVTPYGTLWSNYFDGSSYITMASGTAAGTGDFTIEGWFNVSSYSGGPALYDTRPASTNGAYPAVFVDASGYLVYYVNTAVQIQGATLVGINTWNHFALCRSGTSTRLFLNGVQQGSTYSDTNNYLMGGSRPILGGNGYVPGGASQLTGYLSNIRAVNGTALYTAAFTPSTNPLTAISGTVLLTCQSNRFRDASTNNVAVSVSGAARVTPYSPFILNAPGISYSQSNISYWSGYFDGSGTVNFPANSAFDFGTGNFTMECWVCPTATSTVYLMGQAASNDYAPVLLYLTSGRPGIAVSPANGTWTINAAVADALVLNAWTHLAVVRNGNKWSIYVNGVENVIAASTAVTPYTSTDPMAIGGEGVPGLNYPLYGYVSDARIVKGTAVYTSNFTPPTTPLTAISGTSLLTCQNAAFTDNSTNKFVATVSGTTTITGNNPYQSGYYSNYFDGNGDYLSVPSNAAFSYGTGDFTMEAWVYKGGSGSMAVVDSFTSGSGGTFGFSIQDTTISGYQTNVVAYTFTATVPLNTWTHVAFARTGGNLTCYVNGTSVGSQANSANFTSSNAIIVGRNAGSGTEQWLGYISNLRIVKGTAVYTGNFTPSTTPLTAVSGTSLLTCQANRLLDSSTNNFTVTKNGDVAVSPFDPFYSATIASNGGSMYFDGSGDYLSAPSSPAFQFGTNDFTIEYWVNKPAAANGAVLDARSGGTGAVPWAAYIDGSNFPYFYDGASYTSSIAVTNNAWNHVAIVRTSGVLKIFVNGVQGYSAAYTASLNATGSLLVGGTAAYMTGYLSDIRIVKGTAVYTSSFTPPTAPLTPSANTTLLLNGMNAGVYDAAMQQNMETVGNAQVSSAQAKYGTTSVSFDGVGDQLLGQTNPNLAFGTGDFTIEAWVYQTQRNTLSDITSCHNYGVGADWLFSINSSGNLFFQISSSGTGSQTSSSTVPLNTWTHVAVSRRNGVVKQFIAGTEVSSATYATSVANTIRLSVGSSANLNANSTFYGYIDDLRITNGYARYTANFTPPTAALPVY